MGRGRWSWLGQRPRIRSLLDKVTVWFEADPPFAAERGAARLDL
jgi:hypothetical protein